MQDQVQRYCFNVIFIEELYDKPKSLLNDAGVSVVALID